MVMDQVINSLKQRFSEHGSLYADLSCLDPRNFAEILKRMPCDALQHLSGLLKKCDDTVTKDQLQTELLDFARKWENFQTTLEDEYNMIFEMEVKDSVSDNIQQSESQHLTIRYQVFLPAVSPSSDVFLGMVKLVFDYAINVTADVMLSGHYVKLERLQHHGNWFKNR
ncbi:hypothetical protein BgiMline_010540 [Biomphalaria glabrata]|nr:hypothetical protein BgiMline_024259 [Biomphalaria glabrata]